MLPLVVLAALKLPTVLALVSVVPPTELVVNRPVVLTVPTPAIFPEEVAPMAPELLLTAALTVRSLPAPVLARATAPEPPAVTAAPIVSAPASAVKKMLPLAAALIEPVVVRLPV